MENNREQLVKQFSELFNEAVKKGLLLDNVRKTLLEKPDSEKNVNTEQKWASKLLNSFLFKSWKAKLPLLFLTCGIFCSVFVYSFNFVTFDYTYWRCLIGNNGFVIEISRPLVNCSICQHLESVPIEHNISADEFRQNYAYSITPVLIKDATRSWTAMETFSYDFFKKLYTETEDALKTIKEECQFFPYKTEFETLADVFNISEDRANFKEGETPWYIGWSNCHKGIQMELRKHYQRPYFLPNDFESSWIDWIFMGGFGPGAFIHIDYVQKPSWQAQIAGRKTWTLFPSPECESVCKILNVTVDKGDIIVLDTNQWYHSTYIHTGEMSITIGSEYD